MKTIQGTIYNDMHTAKAPETKSALKVISGELQRQSNKILTDIETVKILKVLIKYEIERLDKLRESTKSIYLIVLESYIPEQVNSNEIYHWILHNVDFSKLKNKMQAISIVTKHFGLRVDGNIVKDIVVNWKE